MRVNMDAYSAQVSQNPFARCHMSTHMYYIHDKSLPYLVSNASAMRSLPQRACA